MNIPKENDPEKRAHSINHTTPIHKVIITVKIRTEPKWFSVEEFSFPAIPFHGQVPHSLLKLKRLVVDGNNTEGVGCYIIDVNNRRLFFIHRIL
jgi:hypothetical protein